MADNDLLSKVTVALRRSDMPEELTQEVSDLVDAALADLKQAGVSNLDTQDPLDPPCRHHLLPRQLLADRRLR